MSKKPKPWRGHQRQPTDCAGVIVEAVSYQPDREANCTVVPDGADMPMPAHVRRLIKAALGDDLEALISAGDAYLAAEAKRKAKKEIGGGEMTKGGGK